MENISKCIWIQTTGLVFTKMFSSRIMNGSWDGMFHYGEYSDLQWSPGQCILLLTTRPGLTPDQNKQKLLLTLTSKSNPDNSILDIFITIYFIRTGSCKIRKIPMVDWLKLLVELNFIFKSKVSVHTKKHQTI